MSRRVLASASLIAIVVLLLASVVAVRLVESSRGDVAHRARPELIWVTASPVRIDESFQASVEVEMAEPDAVAAGGEGVVGQIATTAGAAVTDGELIAWIAGYPVYAIASPRPLWRPLGSGTRGLDVEWLQQFLARRSLLRPDDVDGLYGDETREAWHSLLSSAGVVRADFDDPAPSYFAWLATSPLEVAGHAVRPGQRVSVGDPLLVGPPTITRLAVEEPDDAPARAGAHWELAVASVDVPYDRSTGELTTQLPPKARELFAAVDEGDSVEVTVRRSDPIRAWAIPATAAVVDGASTCVLVEADGEPNRVRVTLVGGSLGSALLGNDPVGRVLANPGVAGLGTEC